MVLARDHRRRRSRRNEARRSRSRRRNTESISFFVFLPFFNSKAVSYYLNDVFYLYFLLINVPIALVHLIAIVSDGNCVMFLIHIYNI